ncbi:MAG: hypothetical protein E3J66_00655, partial [Dehalococcoidia bacterium]
MEIGDRPEICFEGKVPLPPNVRPVIILEGSDYDMGYQYYQQLVQVFGRWMLKEVAPKELTDEGLTALRAYQWYLRKYAPEMIDLFKGMADGGTDAGVPLSYEDVLAHCTGIEYILEAPPRNEIKSYPGAPPGSERVKLPPECSGWAAWGRATKDGELICGASTDHEHRCEVTIVVFPESGNNFIISPFRPTMLGQLCGHPGMNNKGLAYVQHGATHWIQCKPREKYTYGITEGTAILHTLRFADCAGEAKDMQLDYPSGDGYAGGFWADIDGSAFIIECRENPIAIRHAGDFGETDFLYQTNNALHKDLGHCQAEPGGRNVYIPHGGWLGSNASTIQSIARNLGVWNMLHNYQGEVDLNFAKMIYRFSGEPPAYPTLEEADDAWFARKGEGWDQKICHQNNALVSIVLPDDGDEGLYYVCAGCAAEIANPLGPQGHHYLVSPTHSFYQLKLASSPDKLVEAAKRQAQYDLYYADHQLMKLNYSDAAYAPLNEIFNRAATEWIKGSYYQSVAAKTE